MNQDQAANVIGVKSTNPKDMQGLKKIPFHLFPMTAIAVGALQMMDGAGKYGRENYRNESVKASIYYDAAIRHLNEWFSGEDNQQDNGLRHLGGALASIAIIVDAQINQKLIDDRSYDNRYILLTRQLNAETVRLASIHADKDPKHYTKLDTHPMNLLASLEYSAEKQIDLPYPGWFEEDEYFEFVEFFNLIMDAELRQRA